jgi:hypothetical protein
LEGKLHASWTLSQPNHQSARGRNTASSRFFGDQSTVSAHGIEITSAEFARWWEPLATISLARFFRDTNRRDEVRAILADIYNWFTEGFDTADLKGARLCSIKQLDQLGSSR